MLVMWGKLFRTWGLVSVLLVNPKKADRRKRAIEVCARIRALTVGPIKKGSTIKAAAQSVAR